MRHVEEVWEKDKELRAVRKGSAGDWMAKEMTGQVRGKFRVSRS